MKTNLINLISKLLSEYVQEGIIFCEDFNLRCGLKFDCGFNAKYTHNNELDPCEFIDCLTSFSIFSFDIYNEETQLSYLLNSEEISEIEEKVFKLLS